MIEAEGESRDPVGQQSAAPFRGDVLRRGDPGYEQAREITNQRLQRTPALIARCLTVTDVRAALGLARERGLAVSVRGGGHSLAGWSSNTGEVVIDLSRMRWARIDTSTSTAWVGGGTLSGDLVIDASQFGLAPITGTFPQTGIAGLVMGAGEGYLSPRYGFGADHVLALDLVTADGSVLRVSADEHPERFLAMRGAGANFGVVTALKLRLHPAPRHCVGGYLAFDATDAPQVTRHMWEMMRTGSEYFYPFVTYERSEGGRLQVRVDAGHTGPADVAEREIGALRACGSPISDEIREMSYVELVNQESHDVPPRIAADIFRFKFDGSPGDQMGVLLALAKMIPRRGAELTLWRSVPPDPGASAGAVPRLRGISVICSAWWDEVERDKEYLGWVDATAAEFRASSVVAEAANTVNHVSAFDHHRVKDLYGEAAYKRLQALKAKYDPENRFRHNYNVPPA